MVRLPSGARYWTVLDEDLAVVPAADSFLRQVRFGRDGAESTTRAYAGGIALFLRWCARTGRDWQAGIGQLGLFMTWLLHAGPSGDGAGAEVVAGPGARPARSARRVNAVLAAVRGMVVHAVAEGTAPGYLVQVLYEVADDRDLPDGVRPEEGGTGWRMRARHRLHEPETVVDRASDEDVVAVQRGCFSARDRLIVVLMARAGLRRGEVLGLRRSDVHLLADSSALGCGISRAHLHVVRRDDNPNRAAAKSRRQRAVPLDFMTVQAFDAYEFERMTVPAAASADFVFVNLFRSPVGAPMRLDAVNDLVAAAARRAGIASLLLAAVQGERLRGGCVFAGGRGFRGGSGCGGVACGDTVSVSGKGTALPVTFSRSSGRAVRVRGGTIAHGREQRGRRRVVAR